MSSQQQYSLNMSGEGGEESDVVTMDDLQFGASLDVLLASEGGATSFVETPPAAVVQAANIPPPSAPSMVSAGSSSSGPMRTSDTTTSTGASPSLTTMASGRHAATAAMPDGTITHTTQQMAASDPPTKPPPLPVQQSNSIRPSPLTARLNFPMSAVGQPSHPYQGYAGQQGGQYALAPSGGGRKSGAQPRTMSPPMTSTATTRRKRGRDNGSSAVSEDESERQKRRLDRNLREQQRSHRITEQIGHLRDVLAASNVHFKPDKYSTLVSVVDYIKQLQSRSTLLDSEHQKLLDTIQRTNETINNPHYPQGTNSDTMGGGAGDLLRDPHGLEDEIGVFVRGLDYKNVFKHCGIALAVTSIDGKFMDCNPEFEELTGYSRAELLPTEAQSPTKTKEQGPTLCPDEVPSGAAKETGLAEEASRSLPPRNRNLSLFNLLAREHMEQVFLAMSRMLKQPMPPAPDNTAQQPPGDYWTGVVSESRKQDSWLRMNVSLVRSPRGNPKFFNCSMSPTLDTRPTAQPVQAG